MGRAPSRSTSRSSYAYSDSYYDAPLLDAVGYPVAVNPDLRLAGLARLRGWPIRHLDLPEGVPKIAGRELQAWTRFLQRPELLANVRLDIEGVEQIPREGPVIVVFNHRSYFDGTVVGTVLGQTGRSFRFLGKKEVFDVPGHRRVRPDGRRHPGQPVVGLRRAARGGRSRCCSAGEAIALAPEGTIPRGPAFFATELRGRWGAARLAAATRAPVIPVGLWGTEKVWPRNARLPRLATTELPEIRVRVGDPVAAALPQRGRRHEADHGGADGPAARRGTRRARSRRTRSWPPPTRPATAAIPTREDVRRPGTDT